jgi:hypothetical protein
VEWDSDDNTQKHGPEEPLESLLQNLQQALEFNRSEEV